MKSVVHNQVLPALENATRAEVKAAVEDQIANGLIDVISQVGFRDIVMLEAMLI